MLNETVNAATGRWVTREFTIRLVNVRLVSAVVIVCACLCLTPEARGAKEITFKQPLPTLPAKEKFVLVYNDADTKSVEAEISFDGQKYDPLNVVGPEEGAWRITVNERLSYGETVYFRITRAVDVDPVLKKTVNKLLARAVAVIFEEDFDGFFGGEVPEPERMPEGPGFKKAATGLSNYRWQIDAEVVDVSELLTKLPEVGQWYDDYRSIVDGIANIHKHLGNVDSVLKQTDEAAVSSILDTSSDAKVESQKQLDTDTDDNSMLATEILRTLRSAIIETEKTVAKVDSRRVLSHPYETFEIVQKLRNQEEGFFKRFAKILNGGLMDSLFPDGDHTDASNEVDSLIESYTSFLADVGEFNEYLIGSQVLEEKTSASAGAVEGLRLYFGVDTSILGISHAGEIQGFLGIAIYLQKQPESLQLVGWNKDKTLFFTSRITPMVGFSIGIIGDSSLPADTYYLGLGLRMNRYMRFTAGWVFYEVPDEARITGLFAFGVSFDARAFIALRGQDQ